MQSWNAIVITDADPVSGYRVQQANPAFCAMTGYTADELRGQRLSILQGPDTDPAVIDELRQCLKEARYFEGSTFNYRKDGSLYHAEQNISPIIDDSGQITHFVSMGRDVSERVQLEQELRSAATVDQLTGLYTRGYGEQLLEMALDQAHSDDHPLALILCDIDHFKRVNDTFGHASGDRVLADVAQQIRQSVRSSDAVIRWGGEEFLIVLSDCVEAVGMDLAERIRQRVEALVDEEVGTVTLSLGLATFRDGENADGLVERADEALYAAKRGGRNQLVVAS